jgi:hypothetical protein
MIISTKKQQGLEQMKARDGRAVMSRQSIAHNPLNMKIQKRRMLKPKMHKSIGRVWHQFWQTT